MQLIRSMKQNLVKQTADAVRRCANATIPATKAKKEKTVNAAHNCKGGDAGGSDGSEGVTFDHHEFYMQLVAVEGSLK